MMTEQYFFCLRQLLRCDARLFHFVNDAHDQLLRRFAFLWIDSGINAK